LWWSILEGWPQWPSCCSRSSSCWGLELESRLPVLGPRHIELRYSWIVVRSSRSPVCAMLGPRRAEFLRIETRDCHASYSVVVMLSVRLSLRRLRFLQVVVLRGQSITLSMPGRHCTVLDICKSLCLSLVGILGRGRGRVAWSSWSWS
jgi:hypothetical protein